ncbi:hypothetical protein ACFQ1I_34660 [Kitasatospora arboriphila]
MGTFLDITLAVALVLLLGRTTFRRGPNAGSMALIVVVGGIALWRGLGPGAGWLVPVVFAVLALALLQVALAVAVLGRVRVAAPAELRGRSWRRRSGRTVRDSWSWRWHRSARCSSRASRTSR